MGYNAIISDAAKSESPINIQNTFAGGIQSKMTTKKNREKDPHTLLLELEAKPVTA